MTFFLRTFPLSVQRYFVWTAGEGWAATLTWYGLLSYQVRQKAVVPGKGKIEDLDIWFQAFTLCPCLLCIPLRPKKSNPFPFLSYFVRRKAKGFKIRSK